MKAIQTEEYKGYAIKVYYDTEAESPRDEWSPGTFYSNTRRYRFGGDEKPIEGILNGEGRLSEEFKASNIYIPVYLYCHSGSSVWTQMETDFSNPCFFGILALGKDDIRRDYKVARISRGLKTRIMTQLDGQVAAVNQYFHGEVYGYEVEDESGGIIDSCWSFYDTDYLLEVAREAIDAEAQGRERASVEFWGSNCD